MDPNYLLRLEVDAKSLDQIGFDVLFETIGNGYGIALTKDEWQSQAIVFWLSPEYPKQPPLVLVKKKSAIDRIEFDADAWSNQILLSDVTTALLDGGVFA
jgi:hypothetical protein